MHRDTVHDLNSGLVALTSIAEPFFDGTDARLDAQPTLADDIPQPFLRLLVHQDHMTARLTEHYGRSVFLSVLEDRRLDSTYTRKILLTLDSTETVVEFGIARIILPLVPKPARDEILARQDPLGDILIRHNVLRSIDPKWYLRFGRQSPFVRHFGGGGPVFGRVGIIHCNRQPAIQLLEIVNDAPSE